MKVDRTILHLCLGQTEVRETNIHTGGVTVAVVARALELNVDLVLAVAFPGLWPGFVLIVVVIFKFNAKANPVPSKTTHHTLIEVIWTIVPVLILVGISVPSFRLLFSELDVPKSDLTIKATGKQWYWTYSYPDNGKFEFDSLLATDKQPRLLAVDNELVVPVNKVVRVQVIGADVIHSFAVPAFGIKIDAVPGRLNETWFKAEQTGMFYGQCSELCGKDHAYMPIAVRVVTEDEFKKWVADAQKKYASARNSTFASIEAVAH